MEMIQLEEAASELLAEAAKTGNLIMRMRDEGGEFVKAKRPYMEPPQVRATYLQALLVLIEQGQINPVLKNRELEVFEITPAGRASRSTMEQAKEHLIEEMRRSGGAFKVHSIRGDYVQCGSRAHDSIENERILFLEALCDLLSHGVIQVVSETREISRYELAPEMPGLSRFN